MLTPTDTFPLQAGPRSLPASAGGMLLAAAAYYLTALAGLHLATVDGNVTLLWPPTGIAVAAVLRGGYRYLLAVFAAALAVSLPLTAPLAAVGIACGNTVGPAAAVWLLRRLRFHPAFGNWRDVLVLFAAAAVGMTLTAGNGAAWLCGTDSRGWDRFPTAFATWWLGDTAGVLVFGPVLLAWQPFAQMRERGQLRAVCSATGGTAVVSGLAFFDPIVAGKWALLLAFLPFLAAARTATIHRAWPAAVQVLVVAGFAGVGCYLGTGPSRYMEPTARPYLLWAYLVALSGLVLSVSGLLAEQERAAKQTRASEQQYRAIVEDNPALICRFRTDGNLIFANETYRRTLGGWAAAVGTDFYQAAGLPAEVVRRVRRLRFEDEPLTCEAHAGGRWVRWVVRPVDATSSVITEFHAVGLDITREKKADSDRRAVEASAVQTQKLESIGLLAGGIAHEFNNILTGVMGNAELAQLTAAQDDPVQEFLTDVKAGALRAAELTKELLAYAGKADLVAGPVDLSELVRGSVGLLTVAVPKRCPLHFDLADGLPLVAADAARVRQVLVSLVTNAGEALAGRDGSVTVRIGESYYDPADGLVWLGNPGAAGWYVRLEVADTGCGMSAEALARAFEPFFSTKFPGRGLGLPAVLGIVREHGGAVRLDSTPDGGTTAAVLFRPLPPETTNSTARELMAAGR